MYKCMHDIMNDDNSIYDYNNGSDPSSYMHSWTSIPNGKRNANKSGKKMYESIMRKRKVLTINIKCASL